MDFEPDYHHIVAAAYNREAKRLPMYEHCVGDTIVEQVMNRNIAQLRNGNASDINEYFNVYCSFFKKMGYDTVSYEDLCS